MPRLTKKVDDNWFIKFNPKDWLGDSKLRMCSMAAKGLWIDLLCLMHEENPRGVITSDLRKLTRLLPYGKEEIEAGMLELHREGVLSLGREVDPRLPEKALVSRRMYRESMVRMSRVEAGRKGGQSGRGESKNRSRKTVSGRGDAASEVVELTAARDSEMDRIRKQRKQTQSNMSAKYKQNASGPKVVSGNVYGGLSVSGESESQANFKQNASLIVRSNSKSKKAEVRDLRLRDGVRAVGDVAPVSLAQIFGEFQSNRYLDLLLERIFAVARDGPSWQGWWCQVIVRIHTHSALVGEVESLLCYVEDCQDEQRRKLKDLGELKEPGRYLVSKVLFAARMERIVLPELPKTGT